MYRVFKNRSIISREGRDYVDYVREDVALQHIRPVTGRLKIEIWAYPPDNRARDLDNLLKALLDSMQKAGVYENDAAIDDLRIIRMHKIPKGRVDVRIMELGK
jgi:crossover junction endodeoxyribonuclease RusA